MSQIYLIGSPGAGKSYSGHQFYTVPQLADADNPHEKPPRRVVTNIRGTNPEKISAYINKIRREGISSEHLNIEPNSDWQDFDYTPFVKVLTDEDLAHPQFFYDDADIDPTQAIIQPDDVLILDEAWSIIGSTAKYTKRIEKFFAMRRHHNIDIIILSQTFSSLNKEIRLKSDFVLRMTKLKVVNMENRFRVDYFAGADEGITRRKPFDQKFYVYRKEIFDLYQSTQIGDGKEAKLDKRLSLWNVKYFGLPLFKFWLPLAVFLIIFGIWKTVSFFTNPEQVSKAFNIGKGTTAAAATPSANASAAPATSAPPAVPKDSESSKYRLVGLYRFNGLPIAVIADAENHIKYVDKFELVQAGPVRYIRYQGDIIASWTGPANQPSPTASPAQNGVKQASKVF